MLTEAQLQLYLLSVQQLLYNFICTQRAWLWRYCSLELRYTFGVHQVTRDKPVTLYVGTRVRDLVSPACSQVRGVETRPRGVESRPRAVESRPRGVESRPRAVESRPRAVESRPRAVESHPRAVESRPREVESRPREFESRPRGVESRTCRIESRASLLRDSHTRV